MSPGRRSLRRHGWYGQEDKPEEVVAQYVPANHDYIFVIDMPLLPPGFPGYRKLYEDAYRLYIRERLSMRGCPISRLAAITVLVRCRYRCGRP